MLRRAHDDMGRHSLIRLVDIAQVGGGGNRGRGDVLLHAELVRVAGAIWPTAAYRDQESHIGA